MDIINPLSLLEVTMGEDAYDDNDCIIIEDSEETQSEGGENSQNISQEERMEVEVDPLYVTPSEMYVSKQSDMSTLWVTTNINNLQSTSHAEIEYRKKKYHNIYEVLKENLHCSICLDHVGCDIRVHLKSNEHPLLKVLVCEKCAITYRTASFILNEKGKELSCRWCGKISYGAGPALRTCQQCPFSFCELCLHNNSSDFDEPRFPWTCYVCNMKVLWPARATLWALQTLKNLLLTDSDNELAKINGDISLCCKGKRTKKKKSAVQNAPATPTIVDPLDLDHLVPPHILNGSTETGLCSEQPQPALLNAFAVNGHPRTQEFKGIKFRAKPKPKAKAKPKPNTSILQKKQQAFIQQPSVLQQTSFISSQEHKAVTDKKRHWLRAKLIGYMNDFDQFRAKLEDIEKSLDANENHNQMGEKIDAITTLLSLHGDLLNNCRMNLINEWKEKKARTVLENYQPNIQEVNENTIANPLILPLVQLKSIKKKKTTKARSRKKQNKSRSNANRNQYNELNIVGKSDHGIKDCFVKLKKLKMPLPIVEKDCYIKLERIDEQPFHLSH